MDPQKVTQGTIYCFWHSQLLQFAYRYRHCGMTAVVSGSRDGEMAARVAHLWGHSTIRGSSSSKGVQVIRNCVRTLRCGKNIAVIPDGPRGPREKVKPGIAEIALLSGAPVVAVRAHAHPVWRLSSWDRFVIPRPFAGVIFSFAPAIQPSRFGDHQDAVGALTAAIQKALA